jgi:hypothetical protein
MIMWKEEDYFMILLGSIIKKFEISNLSLISDMVKLVELAKVL